jgi:hypothetical protein
MQIDFKHLALREIEALEVDFQYPHGFRGWIPPGVHEAEVVGPESGVKTHM